MEKQLTCINCPIGCALTVRLEDGGAVEVTGNQCPRGVAYARVESTHPTRTVTSTVRLCGGGTLPVKTREPIPKRLALESVRALARMEIASPVRLGDVVLPDVCGTGVDFVATRSTTESDFGGCRE